MTEENIVSTYKRFAGSSNPNWKGGRQLTSLGYIEVYYPTHPYRTVRNTVREHRLVMEDYLGRYLSKEEEVHHKNGIKTDNRIDNLELLSKSDHTRKHMKGNKYSLGRHKDVSDRQCHYCGSNKTYMIKPNHRHKTPCPHWLHLPTDKVNWYCSSCYVRLTSVTSS